MNIRKRNSSLLEKYTPKGYEDYMVNRVVKGRESANKNLRGSSLDHEEADDMKFPIFKVNITRKRSSDKRSTFMKTQSIKNPQSAEVKENFINSFLSEDHNGVRFLKTNNDLPISYINENQYTKNYPPNKGPNGKSGKLFKGLVFGSLSKLNRSRRLP